jgi:hypothetical protein
VVLRLDAPGRITGRLAGFRQRPDVRVVRADGSAPAIHAALDGAEAFHADGLSPGHYRVTAGGESEAAAADVDLAAGQTVEVALTSSGTTRLDGVVRDFRGGAPIPDLRCQLALASGLERSTHVLPAEAWSDSAGRFSLDAPGAPTYAVCWGGSSFSDAVAPVLPGASLELFAVRRADDGRPPGILGAWFDYSLVLAARIARIRPGGPFDRAGVRAGDVIVSVDGASVAHLGEAAIELLVRNAGAGGHLQLGLTRAGRPVSAEPTLDTM